MLKKILLCSLIINITSFTFSFNINSNLFNYKGLVYNPYRVFNLPPWSSMKKIKKKYNELVRKYHPDKSHTDTRKEFEMVQQSYDLIKKKRKENEESENEIAFSTVITDTIRSVINIELIFLGIYMLAYITYSFQMLIFVPLFYMIFAFTFMDNMIPHWFQTEYKLYISSFIVGIVLFILHKKYFKNIFKIDNLKIKII